MLDESALNFNRADAIVGCFEDIIGAPDEHQIAFSVALNNVAGAIDRAFQRNQISIIPLVARHERGRRRIERQAQLAFFGVLVFGVEQADAIPRKRPAHGADFELLSRRIADLSRGFGLAVAIANSESPGYAYLFDDFRVQRLTGAGQFAQPGLPVVKLL